MIPRDEANAILKAAIEFVVPRKRNYFAYDIAFLVISILLDIREELSGIEDHLRGIRSDVETMRLRK